MILRWHRAQQGLECTVCHRTIMLHTTLPDDLYLWCPLSQYFLIKGHFDKPANLHKAPIYSFHKKNNPSVQFRKKNSTFTKAAFLRQEVHVCTFICSKKQAQILDTCWIEGRYIWDGVAPIYVTKQQRYLRWRFLIFFFIYFFPLLVSFCYSRLTYPN